MDALCVYNINQCGEPFPTTEDSFEGSVPDPVTIPAAPHHLQPPTKAPKGTAAAMQRQTMQHVLTQLSQPPSRRLPPRHGRVQGQTHAPACSRNASTSDEDECRCSSSLGGEHSPAVSMHASAAPQPGSNTLRGHCSADAVQDVIAVRSAYNPHRPLARSVSLPSSGNAAHHGAVGPAWLHGNALGCKAMQAVLQQAMPQSMGKRTAGDGRHGDATHAAGGDGRGHGAVAAPQCEPARWLEDVTVEDDKRPWCDMERLMLCITPLMHGNKAPHAITLVRGVVVFVCLFVLKSGRLMCLHMSHMSLAHPLSHTTNRGMCCSFSRALHCMGCQYQHTTAVGDPLQPITCPTCLPCACFPMHNWWWMPRQVMLTSW